MKNFGFAFGDTLFFIEKKSVQKILGKINAQLKAGTRPHLFCQAARALSCVGAFAYTYSGLFNTLVWHQYIICITLLNFMLINMCTECALFVFGQTIDHMSYMNNIIGFARNLFI